MMLRGNNYTTTPFTDERMAHLKKFHRREKIDRVLRDILWFIVGAGAMLIYASYYPL